MDWNEALYQYHRQHGGTFLGPAGQGWRGELIFEHKNTPLVVRHETIDQGRVSLSYIRVLTTLQLDRPYTLTISRENVVSQGIKLVLNQEDYGCPKLSKKRSIRTKEKAFTKLVLKDEKLIQSLQAWPDLALSVEPAQSSGDGLHVLSSLAPLSGFLSSKIDWGLKGSFDLQMPNPDVDPIFNLRMDGMILLVMRGRGAVLEWRI